MSKKKTPRRNKKGNVVLDRDAYAELLNRDKESGTVQFLDNETIDPEMFNAYDVTRENVSEVEGLSGADRVKLMNYFDQTPIARSAKYVMGKPNDRRPEQSSVAFIANPEYADYSDFVEDDPEPVQRMGVSSGMIRPNYSTIQPTGTGDKMPGAEVPELTDYKPKKRMIKPEGFRYGSNKPAKGSITRRKRPRH